LVHIHNLTTPLTLQDFLLDVQRSDRIVNHFFQVRPRGSGAQETAGIQDPEVSGTRAARQAAFPLSRARAGSPSIVCIKGNC
jgi:hypothetical protein